MTSEFGVPPQPPQEAQGLPSRRATVLVTAFFGLFGLIPASRHSRRAEQLGVPGGRYFTAFGITFAAMAVAWAGVVAVVLVTVVGNGDAAEPAGATAAESKAKIQQVEGQWTVDGLRPALESFADDEYSENGEDNGFDDVWGALVPCGGQGVHGLAPDVLGTTTGGYKNLASAQVLPGPEEAQRELARQTEILRGCTAGYEIYGADGESTHCVPSIQTAAPAVRYEDACGDGAWPYVFAIFRADNAVITVLGPDRTSMEWMLPMLMDRLDVD